MQRKAAKTKRSTKSNSNSNQRGKYMNLFALFKGESGAGKSVGALSFPSPYVFDFDQKMPRIAKKHFPDKEFHWDTFKDIFEVDKKLKELEISCPYETLIADSFTLLGNLCFSSIASVKGTSLISRLQSVNSKTKEIDMLGHDYYNAEDQFCTYFVDKLKMLYSRPAWPNHVILTAHIVQVDQAPDRRTKLVTSTRSILAKGKKTAAWLPTNFDDVYLLSWKKSDLGENSVRRICVTESYEEDSAKCSTNLPSMIDFTNASLYEKLFPERSFPEKS
jgi:hypothetical protein